MKILLALTLSAICCLGADVTGNWLVSQPTPDGFLYLIEQSPVQVENVVDLSKLPLVAQKALH